jgi:hypothetical protein
MVQANWWVVMVGLAMASCGGEDFSTKASEPVETGGAATTVESGGAVASSGRAATGGETVNASGAPATGGNAATGGASAATGGAIATGGAVSTGGAPGAAGSVASCLAVIKPGCVVCDAAPDDKVRCQKVIDCWLTNSCGPTDLCATGSGVCSQGTLGVDMVQFDAAKATYVCSCVD